MPRIRNWKDLKWFRPAASEVYRNIDDLFTKDAAAWDLMACHLPDMLQVAQSIQAGRISPSTILRKLGTASRKNKFYYVFRELGQVVRTAFLLDYISNEELQSPSSTRKRWRPIWQHGGETGNGATKSTAGSLRLPVTSA
jgi:TnpA family transposase